jgi:hypothetical protein
MAQIQRKLREGILETLRLLASREAQLEYRRNVPIADVSAELFCAWDDVFWPDDTALRAEFSESEWVTLLRFHSVFERVSRLMPHQPLPPIVLSPHWLQLSRQRRERYRLLIQPTNMTPNQSAAANRRLGWAVGPFGRIQTRLLQSPGVSGSGR